MPEKKIMAGKTGSFKPSPEVLKLIAPDTLRRFRFVPLHLQDGELAVLMEDGRDPYVMDQLRVIIGRELRVLPANKDTIEHLLNAYFPDGSGVAMCNELADGNSGQSASAASDPDQVSKTMQKLFNLAIREKASDIHLEPQRQGLFVRLRVDGELKTIHEFPSNLQPAIISHVKVLACMDVSEKRLPQDGQLNIRAGEKNIDLRVSTLPSKYGEKMVIRVLDKSNITLSLDQLGFNPDMQSVFEGIIEMPHGLILVTGPTGSGKTTTLYTVLNRLRTPLKNIITLEDPIEYELLAEASNEMGVTQVQLHPKIGLTFAAGLRAALRQDPDIIMLGEIRDRESVEIAMRAAMTGHLVMSTLHTNDAPSTLTRLRDMGVEAHLIASTITGVLAQRLVRLLCPHCKEKYNPPAAALRKLFPGRADIDRAVFYRPKGCDRCRGAGYTGRRGIYELLIMTEELKQQIHEGGSSGDIRRLLEKSGFKTLKDSGMELVFKGLTTAEEIFHSAMD